MLTQINIKRLSALPLFIGMSEKELTEIYKETHFYQRHHKKGSIIVEEGTSCNNLLIVFDGWLQTITHANNKAYRMEELIQAPQILEPDKLFGISPCYRSTFIAYTTCESISLTKECLMKLIEKYMIVRLNYLNIICKQTQKIERTLWQSSQQDLRDRTTAFFKLKTLYPAGKKILYIKMKQLATELGVSRLEISRVLNTLQEEDKIILKRGIIEIPALQLL